MTEFPAQINVQLEDTKPLEKSIEELKAKNIKAIDLVLDGSISKENLKLSNKEYDREIEQIHKRIEAVQNRNEINNDIIAKVKGCNDNIYIVIFILYLKLSSETVSPFSIFLYASGDIIF
jgi:hypothetical protein